MTKHEALKLVSKVLGATLTPEELARLWADDSPMLLAARDRGLEHLFPDPPPGHPAAVRRRAARAESGTPESVTHARGRA